MHNTVSAAAMCVAVAIALFPIVAAQKVDFCSFPGVTCRTCVGRYETGTSYAKSSTQCGWCGSTATNTSDPAVRQGFCLSDKDPMKASRCGLQPRIEGSCDVLLTPASIAGIAIGAAALVSALVCYEIASSHYNSRQYEWAVIGMLLPLVAILIIFCIAKRGASQKTDDNVIAKQMQDMKHAHIAAHTSIAYPPSAPHGRPPAYGQASNGYSPSDLTLEAGPYGATAFNYQHAQTPHAQQAPPPPSSYANA